MSRLYLLSSRICQQASDEAHGFYEISIIPNITFFPKTKAGLKKSPAFFLQPVTTVTKYKYRLVEKVYPRCVLKASGRSGGLGAKEESRSRCGRCLFRRLDRATPKIVNDTLHLIVQTLARVGGPWPCYFHNRNASQSRGH
jgi:hypothetical protein